MNTEEIKIFNEEEINEWIRNTGSEWSFDGKWIRKTYKRVKIYPGQIS